MPDVQKGSRTFSPMSYLVCDSSYQHQRLEGSGREWSPSQRQRTCFPSKCHHDCRWAEGFAWLPDDPWGGEKEEQWYQRFSGKELRTGAPVKLSPPSSRERSGEGGGQMGTAEVREAGRGLWVWGWWGGLCSAKTGFPAPIASINWSHVSEPQTRPFCTLFWTCSSAVLKLEKGRRQPESAFLEHKRCQDQDSSIPARITGLSGSNPQPLREPLIWHKPGGALDSPTP